MLRVHRAGGRCTDVDVITCLDTAEEPGRTAKAAILREGCRGLADDVRGRREVLTA